MTYLRSTTDDVIQDLAKNDKIFQQVLEAEKAFRGNTSNMSEYSFYEYTRNKAAFELMQAKAEAKAKLAEAEAKAEAKVTEAEAKAEAKVAEAEAKVAEAEARVKQAEVKAAEAVTKANLEIAKRLIAMGLSPDAIKEATNLTDSQLAMLTKHQSS